jgi:hypothetical protein
MTRMGITPQQLLLLQQPTPPESIKQRQGNRLHEGNCVKNRGACTLPHSILDYVQARFVMERLDELGPENWQDRFEDRADGSVRCGIGILVDGEWVWKWDVGTESDIESDKGSYSDAFKRSGVKWGIARDLYGHTSTPVAARPASAPRPVSSPAPDGGIPEEPEYLREALAPAGEVRAAVRDRLDTSEGFCPDHGMAWVLQPGGFSKTTGKPYDAFWKCPSKEQPFCKRKPSQAWASAHEGDAA